MYFIISMDGMSKVTEVDVVITIIIIIQLSFSYPQTFIKIKIFFLLKNLRKNVNLKKYTLA